MSIPIPKGATRVQVEDEYGKLIWRKPSEVLNTDTIRINYKTGEAYVMYGKPGVPSSNPINTKTPPPTGASPIPPSNPQANINQLQQRKQNKLNSDAVFDQTKKNADSSEVLTHVLVGLAEESASLAFEREEAERRGESTSQISLRRVNALRAVGDTWIKKKEMMSSKSIDMESKAFKKLFGHIAETFRRACDEAGVRPELAESVFATFGNLVDDPEWLIDAKKAMESDK
tara:strand:- start:747 stop:1436 length:690 start_codon:yes stop_codon:yes gene_type:complete